MVQSIMRKSHMRLWLGGIAVIVDVVTDNRNRSASEIRHIFDKSGSMAQMAVCGSSIKRA